MMRENMFQRFFHSEVSSSIILMGSTIAALFWANSAWSDVYFKIIHTKIGLTLGDSVFRMSLEHWIADGLMVIFFFVVGLEIKRELVVGQLSTVSMAVLPVAAAIGGMFFPALIYILFNVGGEASSGWGIPMATDIAFALGILALFGNKVPVGLKVFLTALAIVDDLGAVLVIALFYTEKIVFMGLILAAVFLLMIFIANRIGVRQMWIYIILAIGAWAGVLISGVHATVAGVLIAMLVPVKSAIDPEKYLALVNDNIQLLNKSKMTKDSMIKDREQMASLDEIYLATENIRPAGLSLENQLHPVQAFMILPLFALFKAGVVISGDSIKLIGSHISLGIIFGLFFGKQIGILLFSWLAVRSGKTSLSDGVTWGQIWGVSVLAGVGFTMSIFISDLAFESLIQIDQAKIAIIMASLISGITGYFIISGSLRLNKTDTFE